MTLPTDPDQGTEHTTTEMMVGQRLRKLRVSKGLSLRSLADLSGLNINTLSLVENAKTSTSVGTLQQLAAALSVPLSAFFVEETIEKQVVFTPAHPQPTTAFNHTQLVYLAQNLSRKTIQPYLVTLKAGMGSGNNMIVHTGHEFVYCIEGQAQFTIDNEVYPLKTGDSLIFEAHLPHTWENNQPALARLLMILAPADAAEEAGSRHVSLEKLQKEKTMKIAVITEDGKKISQHFGRAPYFLVLTIEDGKVTHIEMREKPGHGHFGGRAEETHGHRHGFDEGSHLKHKSMAETISDCKVVLCGGMGMGAYDSMRRLEITPIVTDLKDIDEAVKLYLEGKLVDHPELLH